MPGSLRPGERGAAAALPWPHAPTSPEATVTLTRSSASVSRPRQPPPNQPQHFRASQGLLEQILAAGGEQERSQRSNEGSTRGSQQLCVWVLSPNLPCPPPPRAEDGF